MNAYFCDFCGKVTPHEAFSFYEWQRIQAEGAMEKTSTALISLTGWYKLGDAVFRVIGNDQYQCQACTSIVQPKKGLKHCFYIPHGVSAKNKGKLEGYGGFFYLDDIINDQESLQYLRSKHNPDLLRNHQN